MKKFLLPLLFAAEACFAGMSGIGTDYLRLEPTTLPSVCRIGDLRTNTATSLLMFCSASNTWTPLLVSAAPISVANGGTGLATLTAHDVLIGAGTSNVHLVGPGSASQILTSGGASADPAYSNVLATANTIQPPDGSAGSPSYSFASETGTGWYRVGAAEPSFSVTGTQAVDIVKLSSTQINFGFGTPASAATTNPFNAATTVNNGAHFNYSNLSSGSSSETDLDLGSGPAGGNLFSLRNLAFASTSYIGGGGALDASANLSFLNIAAENASAYIAFNVGGLSAATEAMRLVASGGTGLTLNKGWGSLNLAGSTSGSVSILTQAAAGTYNFNMPITAGSSGQVLTSAGGLAAPMTWTSAFVNPMTTAGDTLYGGASGAATRLANGTAGQILTSSGTTLAPTWSAISAAALSSQGKCTFFASGGTFTTQSTSTTATVYHYKVLGSGGGGGGANGADAAGSGGGAGGLAEGTFTGVSASTGITITVGAAGAAGTTAGAGGGAGNPSSIGTPVSVSGLGGGGGLGSTSASTTTTAGAAGGGTSGSPPKSVTGASGGDGWSTSGSIYHGGVGASSSYGNGGDGGHANFGSGQAAVVYGAGGGGGALATAPGGLGGGGFVEICQETP